jgi:hypothetical protein
MGRSILIPSNLMMLRYMTYQQSWTPKITIMSERVVWMSKRKIKGQ